MAVNSEREMTARHEAGHAVLSIVLGWSVRYVTLRPRDDDAAGTTWSRPPRHCNLLDAGAIFLAGLAAESTVLDSQDRSIMIEGARSDLRDARDLSRHIVSLRERDGDLPGIDPDWSEWDLGAQMWYRACDLVARYGEAIDWVTGRLCASPRAVSGSWIRDAVANSSQCDEPPGPDEWWAPRHSRLKWRRAVA